MIIITNATADLMIEILRDYIYSPYPEEDGYDTPTKATHPIEINLLDLLIEKRMGADND